jgi:predicted RecB family nuclease
MHIVNSHYVYSPSDLTLYLQSEFASWMERLRLDFPDRTPVTDNADSMMGLLQDKGEAHELEVLQGFIDQGLSVADISKEAEKQQATLAVMDAGADVIFQAVLAKPPFKGYADFLVKVPGESNFGDYHYEVWDTKLSKHLKPYFVIQLCCYQDMLESIQGCSSDEMVIALGSGVNERLRVGDYIYYYRALKSTFLAAQKSFSPESQPDPANSKSWGRWETYAKELLIECDHLSQVATLSRSQVKRFNQAGIMTMQGLVDADLAHIPNINQAIFQRLKSQARLQKASVGHEVPMFKY